MSQHSHRARLAALLLVGGALAGAATDAAAADGDRPHRWSGYAIAATGQAAGGWIGGYRVGHRELYLTTPTRRPNRAGFGDAHRVGDLPGRRTSRADTARAAWILSKYGAYRDATQSAAVDATVYHLLAGGAWRVDRRQGARRIRQTGNGAAVARFARIMLRQSRQSAGAYTARLSVAGTDVGGTVAVTLSVRDGHGRPAPGLPVTLGMAGSDAREAVTGDDGQAVARFTADARGWQDVTARVAHVPEHRLLLRAPDRHRQAAAAEGGVTRTLVVTTRAAVRGAQTLALAAEHPVLDVGAPARVVATVGGDAGARTAAAALYGPFRTAGEAACGGAAVGQVSAPVGTDRAYALPPVVPGTGGYHAWRVTVDGTDTNAPVSACGAVVKVRGQAVTAVVADASPVSPDEIGATGSVSGLPFADQVRLTASLAGPYVSAAAAIQDACGTLPFPESARDRAGNGTVHFTVAKPSAPGIYAWQVSASAGDLWLASRLSTCAASGSLVLVQ